MKTITPLLLFPSIILISLVYLFLSTEPNPLKTKYRTLVLNIKSSKQLNSEQEVLNQYPELVKINQLIDRLDQLNYDIRITRLQPIPPGKSESKILLSKQELANKWKLQIKNKIDSLGKHIGITKNKYALNSH